MNQLSQAYGITAPAKGLRPPGGGLIGAITLRCSVPCGVLAQIGPQCQWSRACLRSNPLFCRWNRWGVDGGEWWGRRCVPDSTLKTPMVMCH